MRSLAAALAVVLIAAVPASARPPSKSWTLRLSGPAQLDMTVAQVRVPVRHGRRARIKLSLMGSNGLDYVAAAVPAQQPRGSLVALLLVVNRRPRGSLAPDVVSLQVRANAWGRVGKPRFAEWIDPFQRANAGPAPPAVCDARASGGLDPRELRSVLEAGTSFDGFPPAAAVAHAWNFVCARPYDRRFTDAVQGKSPSEKP